MLIPLSRPGFRLGLYLLRTPNAGNYWRFNFSSAPIKPAPVIPRREKEVFMSKFLQKSQESIKKDKSVEKDPFKILNDGLKGLGYSIVLSVLACIAYGAYDPAYRKSTKRTFPFVFWILSFRFPEDDLIQQEEAVVKQAMEFKSSFLETETK
ncbi:uncharacterized protein LOC111702832 [Eurytemora carolleeae]|uniref:uncharacterized protein LOC111702832 n=1 Tax=Eurytemora carolleeae TaxID=1294199 RepID=UPI000C762F9E|nr:uncharacterized protein LOC111702832 [Eurytemora carolleeae]|eukprot:XP_023330382.1 uncharacterized protein LOC111702832 [Eurytemora affinis]